MHACAFNPCTANWKPGKYGIYGVPIHVQKTDWRPAIGDTPVLCAEGASSAPAIDATVVAPPQPPTVAVQSPPVEEPGQPSASEATVVDGAAVDGADRDADTLAADPGAERPDGDDWPVDDLFVGDLFADDMFDDDDIGNAGSATSSLPSTVPGTPEPLHPPSPPKLAPIGCAGVAEPVDVQSQGIRVEAAVAAAVAASPASDATTCVVALHSARRGR